MISYIYILIICKPLWRERKHFANVLPMNLGPHASGFANIIKSLKPKLRALNDDIIVDINGTEYMVAAFIPAYTSHMLQQLMNPGFGSPQSWVVAGNTL